MTSSMVISILTSNWVIGIIAVALAGALYKWLQPKSEDWQHWIGLALQAVKAAEKAIPENTKHKGLAKADYALNKFIERWEKLSGKKIDSSQIGEVQNLLEIAVQEIEKTKVTPHAKAVKKNH